MNFCGKLYEKLVCALIVLCGSTLVADAQTVLNATGSGNTYQLINSAFGGTAYEVPDCSHIIFGPQITQV
jgi:hypothetical protein